jgi:hypothetical protein
MHAKTAAKNRRPNGKIIKIPASQIVFKDEIYPRNKPKDAQVTRLLDVLRSGSDLDPVYVRRSDNALCEGCHRVKTYVKFYDDPDALVPVVFIDDLEDDRKALLFSWDINQRHGLPLDGQDRASCIIKARALGVSDRQIMASITVSKDDLDRLAARLAYVNERPQNKKRAKQQEQPTPFPLKNPFPHLRGQSVSKKTKEAHDRASGMPLSYHIQQVTLHLKHPELINPKSKTVMANLLDLKLDLELFFKKHGKE